MKLLEIDDQFFRDALRAADKSQREMARYMGLDPAAITLMLQGRRALQLIEAQQIAEFLGIAIEDVLRHAGLQLSRDTASGNAGGKATGIPLLGTIGAGGEIKLDSKSTESGKAVDGPVKLPADAAALRATEDVFAPVVMRGALLYFKPTTVVEPSAIGRLAVVRLGNRSLKLRHVAPGFDFDRFTLSDQAGSQENVALMTATPVLWIKP
jgi:transcriptional regulator with XRE-family HTH domain